LEVVRERISSSSGNSGMRFLAFPILTCLLNHEVALI
jgi:hypothetical protein